MFLINKVLSMTARIPLMHNRPGARVTVFALLSFAGTVGLGTARPAFAQPVAAVEETAEEYALEARALAEKNEHEKAYPLYQKAWKRKKSHSLAANLGLTELALGKIREAAEHFLYSKENFPEVIQNDNERAARERIKTILKDDIQPKIGVAKINVARDDGKSAEGASVFVDGRSVGVVAAGGTVKQEWLRSPDVFVDAGRRRLSATLEGCNDALAIIDAAKGVTVSTKLVLTCKEALSTPILLGGIGVAAAGLGVGLGTHFYSNSRAKDAQSLFNELKAQDGLGACLNKVNRTKCDEFVQADNASRIAKGFSNGGFVIAGVAAVGTGLYAIFGGSLPEKKDTGIQAAFAVTPGGGGAVVRGSF
jgi:tetratricopeptide (TPR) repeat protein